MRTAEELRKIAKEEAPKFIKSLLPTKDRIIETCESRAYSGLTAYTLSFRISRDFPESVLLDCCIDYVNEFEENGYLVVIRVLEDTKQYNKVEISFLWDSWDELPLYDEDKDVVYDTKSAMYKKWGL